MMRPRRMKRVELTVLERDVDGVIELIGKKGVMHFPQRNEAAAGAAAGADAEADELASRAAPSRGSPGRAAPDPRPALEDVRSAAAILGIELPAESGRDARLPVADDGVLAARILDRARRAAERIDALESEKSKVAEALSESRAFANLKAPFSELEQLSYLALRIGRLDPVRRGELSATLAGRAFLMPLDDGDRVVAAASRKGRFALDSELKKAGFVPLSVPEGFTGVPAEMLSGLEARLAGTETELAAARAVLEALREEVRPSLQRLAESFIMAAVVQDLKDRLESTSSAYRLDGWMAADQVASTAAEIERLTDGRVAVRTWNPEEVASVAEGREKVPVSLDHGAFVGGFERLVFSYGAPLYGTVDPTPFVAVSFTILFGLMFGDVGQGSVLLLLGLLAASPRFKPLRGFARFAPALVAVGLSSMAVGFLDGEVFANDSLLIRPTRAITGLLTGVPVDRILHLMPEKGGMDKLFAFFGFTIAVGAAINSIGLVINMVNLATLKRWEKFWFAKTGLAGACLFWYALALAARMVLGGTFAWFDAAAMGACAAAIFLGPALWRLIAGERPVFEHGFLVFAMEGFVELLETLSSYVSNTVSFLRVGAFALSHAVLSFIVFTLSEMVAAQAPAGAAFALLVSVFGNAVIILLEGLIVAIQVVRLQYYEFFSKFFTETGIEFSPFRFRREVKS